MELDSIFLWIENKIICTLTRIVKYWCKTWSSKIWYFSLFPGICICVLYLWKTYNQYRINDVFSVHLIYFLDLADWVHFCTFLDAIASLHLIMSLTHSLSHTACQSLGIPQKWAPRVAIIKQQSNHVTGSLKPSCRENWINPLVQINAILLKKKMDLIFKLILCYCSIMQFA